VQIVAFNAAEGWSRDVTDEITDELRRRCSEMDEAPESLRESLDSHLGHEHAEPILPRRPK
jgi:hypothetical protein